MLLAVFFSESFPAEAVARPKSAFLENASVGVGCGGVISKELGTTDFSVVNVLDVFFLSSFPPL